MTVEQPPNLPGRTDKKGRHHYIPPEFPGRKTCPVCHTAWTRDPAASQSRIMQLRISDFVVGLSPESNSMLAEDFQKPGGDPDMILDRYFDIQSGRELLQAALDRLAAAEAQWAATPAVQALAEESAKKPLTTDRYRVEFREDTLVIETRAEAEENQQREEMQWLLT